MINMQYPSKTFVCKGSKLKVTTDIPLRELHIGSWYLQIERVWIFWEKSPEKISSGTLHCNFVANDLETNAGNKIVADKPLHLIYLNKQEEKVTVISPPNIKHFICRPSSKIEFYISNLTLTDEEKNKSQISICFHLFKVI